MTHLLVTNDFPPKVGGIQSYLWELWSRLDPESFAVLTASSHPDAAAFDAEQSAKGLRIERVPAKVLLPVPDTVRRIRDISARMGSSLVLLDPALPLGLIGPSLGVPYGVILHGAEVTVPARLPGTRPLLGHVLRGARLVVCAGSYPAHEVSRLLGDRPPSVVEIPPGVDLERYRPLPARERVRARRALGLPPSGPLVVSVSRLVPRKGMDVLVRSASRLMTSFPDLSVAIAGEGRDRPRIEKLIRHAHAPVKLLGRVDDELLPLLYASGDVFCMACRSRWLGLEEEGFGIVFLEAAAAGTPQIAGRSGGAGEAVEDGRTGFVVDDPSDARAVSLALRRLLADAPLRRRMARAGRRRVEQSFGYEALAHRLAASLGDMEG